MCFVGAGGQRLRGPPWGHLDTLQIGRGIYLDINHRCPRCPARAVDTEIGVINFPFTERIGTPRSALGRSKAPQIPLLKSSKHHCCSHQTLLCPAQACRQFRELRILRAHMLPVWVDAACSDGGKPTALVGQLRYGCPISSIAWSVFKGLSMSCVGTMCTLDSAVTLQSTLLSTGCNVYCRGPAPSYTILSRTSVMVHALPDQSS